MLHETQDTEFMTSCYLWVVHGITETWKHHFTESKEVRHTRFALVQGSVLYVQARNRAVAIVKILWLQLQRSCEVVLRGTIIKQNNMF